MCTLGGINVYSYGLMIDIGVICAYILMLRRRHIYKIPANCILDIVIILTAAGMIGARLLYVALYHDEFHSLKDLFSVWNGGLSFHGGLLLGLLCVWLYCKYRRLRFLTALDMLSPALCVAYAYGRIGCFLNGCCYGKFSDSFIACPMLTHEGLRTCIPTQLISSACGFGICCILIALQKYFTREGQQLSCFLALFGLYRFVVEFFRYYPSDAYLGALTQGQYISLVMIAAGITAGVLLNKKGKPQ
ncbi:MAG: prolipoprotein diacylglyceryl transferase [Abditibacteriota bacterium]|nr:prolipoprotein diacylglyceryl transferase [Abditibacteriota bacterium]